MFKQQKSRKWRGMAGFFTIEFTTHLIQIHFTELILRLSNIFCCRRSCNKLRSAGLYIDTPKEKFSAICFNLLWLFLCKLVPQNLTYTKSALLTSLLLLRTECILVWFLPFIQSFFLLALETPFIELIEGSNSALLY